MSTIAAGSTLDGMTVAQLEELQQRVQASIAQAKQVPVSRGVYSFDGKVLKVDNGAMSAPRSLHAGKTLEGFLREAWSGVYREDAKRLGELLIAVATRP